MIKPLWGVPHTLDGFWYVENLETGGRKKIGPVTGKGRNYYDEAIAECKRRNFRDRGIRIAPYINFAEFHVFDSEGSSIGSLDRPVFNCSYDRLHSHPTRESLHTRDLKEKDRTCSIYLDRMSVADYGDYCNDPRVTAAGFVPSRLVWVFDSADKILAVYIAEGEWDGFEKYRKAIWKTEVEYLGDF